MQKVYRDVSRLNSTHLQDVTTEDTMTIHLGTAGHIELKDFVVHSSLYTLEQNMIHTASNNYVKTFSPTLCAFAILDQIGNTYEPLEVLEQTDAQNGIKRALHFFGGLASTSQEVKALVAFRNGLIHDGSFTSFSQKEQRYYIFRYLPELGKGIQLSDEEWDNTGSALNEACFTYFGDDAVPSLARRVLKTVREMHELDKLQARLSSTDMIHKFILWANKSVLLTARTPFPSSRPQT